MDNSVISQRIQDSFVRLAITDTRFLQLTRETVKPEYFSSRITEDVVRVCYSYFDQFEEAAQDHFYDEMLRFVKGKDRDERDRYYIYLKRIQEMSSPNQRYVIKRINDFVKAREFEKGAVEFVKKVEAGDFVSAKELMQRTLKVGIEREEVGLKYLDLEKPPHYYSARKEMLIPSGFPLIDEVIKGFRRGQFIMFMAGYKVGKTWSCIHIGKQGLFCGRKVLHISHESSLDEVEKRYDMMLGGLIDEDSPERVEFEEINEEGEQIAFWEEKADTVYDFDQIRETRRKIGKFGGKLIIKKYPMGSCTMEEIERYLDYLETYEGFVPDILINDYVEVMALPRGEERQVVNRAYIKHKKIADERNILVVTVSQVTRAALGKFVLRQADAAEDIRKVGNADFVFGLSQTDIQAEEKRMTVYVLAARSREQKFGCIVSTNLKVGQLCTNCWRMKREERSK